MTDARSPSPRSRGGLPDEICRQIADEIALGEFAPGSRLDEVSLAARFGVSRTPIREALRQLTSMGLVDARPNKGAVVAAMTPVELDQMFEAIGELEASCARHAAVRMTEADRERLRALHGAGRAAMQAGDMARYDVLNLDLHELIIQSCYNPVLIEAVVSLRNRVSSFRRTQFRDLARMAESFAEHTAIVDALLAHDVVTAYREMRAHLMAARSATSRIAPAWASPGHHNQGGAS
jgi:DNA-binding GntR family transcriptional regulator